MRSSRYPILSCERQDESVRRTGQDRIGYTVLSHIFMCSSQMNFRFEYYNTRSNYLILHRLTVIVVIIKVINILPHRSTKMSNRK